MSSINKQERIAVVLLNLGGPDSESAVEPFLFNLFNDPDIINFPLSFLFRKKLAKLISSKRAPKIIKQYNEIGGKSPIYELTKKQAELLEIELNKVFDAKVFIAMRYWKPFTVTAVEEIIKEQFKTVILLPLYPQYSISTTGSGFNEWNRITALKNLSSDVKIYYINNYRDYGRYIDSIAGRIKEGLNKFPEDKRKNVIVLFSAHGTPLKLVKQGDPYSVHIRETVKLTAEKAGLDKYKLCFQSKVGPQKWLKPSTPDVIKEVIKEGYKNILVVPVAFVSDHLETLFELGIEYRKLAAENGAENFIVTEGLNDSPVFIMALSELVINKLKNPGIN